MQSPIRHRARASAAALSALLLLVGLQGHFALASAAAPAVAAAPDSTAVAPAVAAAAPVQAPLGAAGAGAAAGDMPLYQVEMVVFRASYPGSEEDWSSVPAGRGFGAPIGSGAPVPQMVHPLAPSDYRLDGVVNGLRRSGAWRPIAHIAWVQTAPPWGAHTGIALSQLGVDAPGLSGTVFLERAPLYLHLGFDVTLDAGGAPYRIDEMRNIRPNEKQYYDHPAFGIIAAVYPLKHAAH